MDRSVALAASSRIRYGLATMASTKPRKLAPARPRSLEPRPEHLVGQGIVRPGGPDERRHQLFRIRLGHNDKVCVFGKNFPSREAWSFRRFRRSADGTWKPDAGAGLRLDPVAMELFRDGLLRALHDLGSPAPLLSFEYVSERYRAATEEGEDAALVPQLVLKALALALGTGDREGASRLARDALKYIRTHQPEYVTPGDGDGFLDQKGDEGRNPGKERLLRAASEFCRRQGKDIDCNEAADRLGWWVEQLHPQAVRAALIAAADVARASAVVPGRIPSVLTAIYEGLEKDLDTIVDPTPESVARLTLTSFGVPDDKVRHYFDYRYTGVNRTRSGTINLPGKDGALPAYVAQPERKAAVTRAVILIPEMFGVHDQAQQVARRLAREGLLAIVPHFLRSSIEPDENVELLRRIAEEGRKLKSATVQADVAAALCYLERERGIDAAHVALLGFEAGAAQVHEMVGGGVVIVGAAVAFYGMGSPAQECPRTPLLSFLGDRDPWFTEPRRARLTAALAAYGNGSRVETLAGAPRGFFDPGLDRENRRNPPMDPPAKEPGYFDLGLSRSYDPVASETAWGMTIEFLDGHLGPR